jgi:hypothetical protein
VAPATTQKWRPLRPTYVPWFCQQKFCNCNAPYGDRLGLCCLGLGRMYLCCALYNKSSVSYQKSYVMQGPKWRLFRTMLYLGCALINRSYVMQNDKIQGCVCIAATLGQNRGILQCRNVKKSRCRKMALNVKFP